MKHAVLTVLATTVLGSGLALAETDTAYVVPAQGDSVQEDLAPVMLPQRPRDVMKLIGQRGLSPDNWTVRAAVNSHVVFLNRCAGGCAVKVGDDDSRTDHSSIASQNGTLSAYAYGDASWNQVVSCVTATMSRFNIQVTDVDPGTAQHFEVMIGGTPQQIGMGSGIGGVAPVPCAAIGQCDPYLPNALVFDFASVFQGDTLEICSTAAQEIAHAWILDHVIDKTDPMTYNNFSGMRQFKDGMTCGSDCQGGVSPFNQACTGNEGQLGNSFSSHACLVSGSSSTQNDLQMIKALFGPAGAIAPTVAISAPANGATVAKGFTVDATCTTADGISEVDLLIDDAVVARLTASPAHFVAPGSVATGSHKVSVQCVTKNQADATATANITIASGCTTAAMCPNATDLCFNGACVAGMGAPGGLGATCTGNESCTSNLCASDGTSSVCVIGCDPAASNQCPTGYSCTMAGASGVCFPGDGGGGGGGCLSATNGQGPWFLMIGGAVGLLVRRRKRA